MVDWEHNLHWITSRIKGKNAPLGMLVFNKPDSTNDTIIGYRGWAINVSPYVRFIVFRDKETRDETVSQIERIKHTCKIRGGWTYSDGWDMSALKLKWKIPDIETKRVLNLKYGSMKKKIDYFAITREIVGK